MISQEALNQAKQAYDIEAACITEMKNYLDEAQFSAAVELLSKAPKIDAAGIYWIRRGRRRLREGEHAQRPGGIRQT